MPPTQDTFGDPLKIIQIAFYTIGTVIAILIYRAAKRGLLNTVNTEYQKRVMDRLHKLSEDLYSEFDPSSPMYWAALCPVHDAIQKINEVFENNINEILAARKFHYGTPYTEDVLLHRIFDAGLGFNDDSIPAREEKSVRSRFEVFANKRRRGKQISKIPV